MVFVPPACGPVVSTRHSVLFAGVVRFCPLVPSRFSAPEFPPEPESGLAVLAVPYVMVVCSLAAPVPATAPGSRSQISNECVVALLKFFTAFQSTTSHVVLPSLSVAILIVPPAGGLRSLHRGATTLFGRAVFGKCCGRNTTSEAVPPPRTR